MTTLTSYQILDNMDNLPCLCVGVVGEVTGWGKRGMVERREIRGAIQIKHRVNLDRQYKILHKLDGVGPIDNITFTNYLHQFDQKL